MIDYPRRLRDSTVPLSVVLCVVIGFSTSAFIGDSVFLEARALELKGQHAGAAAAYARCADSDPVLSPFATLRAIHCRRLTGDATGALAAYESFLDTAPEGPWKLMAQAWRGKLLLDLGREADAVQALRPIVDLAPQPWWIGRDAEAAAIAAVKYSGTAAWGYDYLRRAVESQVLIRSRLDAAKLLVQSPKDEERAAAVRTMILTGATGDAGKALLKELGTAEDVVSLAQIFEGMLNASAAAEEKAASPLPDPEGAWLRLWLLYMARTRGADTPAALTAADRLLEWYPAAVETGEALWTLAAQTKDKSPDAALGFYKRLADQCPQHERADDALYESGLLHLARGSSQQAVEAFSMLGERYPTSRFRAEGHYRSARLMETAGNAEAARAAYRLAADYRVGDFYAHRAMDRLLAAEAETAAHAHPRVDGTDPFIRAMPLKAVAPAPLPARVLGDPAVQRIRFFAAHGLEEAEWEALWTLARIGALPEAAPLYQAIADAGLSYTALRAAIHHGWGVVEGVPTIERLRLEFPLAYWNTMLSEGKATGIDPYLMLSLSKQESTFRATIASSAGAVGVMQLMPTTAQWLAKVDSDIGPGMLQDLRSPQNSIRFGSRYLMRMISRSGGNLVDALASYNAGPGNRDKWRQRFGGYSLEEFVEAIPFTETRNYVKKVLGNYAAYYSLYPPPAAVSAS